MATLMMFLTTFIFSVAVCVSAEETTLRVLITRVDEGIYSAALDPAYYQGQPTTIFLRTEQCRERTTESEPAVIVVSDGGDRAWLTFGSSDVCEIVKISLDRGSL